MQFLIIVPGYVEYKPDCSCDKVGFSGCRINEPAPPGYKCFCYLATFFAACNGYGQKCKSEEEHGCNGCKEKECCLGRCNGY